MRETEEDAYYQALRKAFVEGHGPVESKIGSDQLTEVVGGVLKIQSKSSIGKPGWFFAHEICHVAEISDDRFFKPNLGFPPATPSANDKPLSAEEQHENGLREAYVIAAQIVLASKYSTPYSKETIDRMRSVGRYFAKPLPDQKQKDAEKEWWATFDRWLEVLTVTKIRRAYFRKIRLVKAANEKRREERFAQAA